MTPPLLTSLPHTPALPELRDIHLPDAVAWWPPAPGWWLVAVIVITLIILLPGRIKKFNRRRQLRKENRARLDEVRDQLQQLHSQYLQNQNPVALCSGLSVLLRRACLSLFEHADVAGLTGKAWLAFLDRQCPLSPPLSASADLLLNTPYQPITSIANNDALQLHHQCKKWLEYQLVKHA